MDRKVRKPTQRFSPDSWILGPDFCFTPTPDLWSLIPDFHYLSILLPLLLAAFLTITGGARADETTPGNTPEEVLDTYIQALREGSLKGVRSVYHPPDVAFYLPEPVAVTRYVIKRKRVLTRADLEGLDLRVQPIEGDVQLDVFQVREVEGQRTYQMLSFWFRLIDGSWKIYAQSAWGGG